MELVCTTEFKKLNPRKDYLAPYIALPWNYDPNLIGKHVSVYNVNGGFFLVTDIDKFKLSLLQSGTPTFDAPKSKQFKQKSIIPLSNEVGNVVLKEGQIKPESTKQKCPRPDLNRRQLDLQSSALPS